MAEHGRDAPSAPPPYVVVSADAHAAPDTLEQFLAYVDPEPTRYALNPGSLIRKFMFLLRPILEGGTVKLDPVRVLPRFVDGASCRAI